PTTGNAATRITIARCKDITKTGSFNIVTARWLVRLRGRAIDLKPLVGKLTHHRCALPHPSRIIP
ncbi:hypothetical protein ABTP42_19890, partial [Acinetobacter baumannii]